MNGEVIVIYPLSAPDAADALMLLKRLPVRFCSLSRYSMKYALSRVIVIYEEDVKLRDDTSSLTLYMST